MKLSDIKPCAECGSKHFNVDVVSNFDNSGKFFVALHCTVCFNKEMQTGPNIDDTFDKAAREWNGGR